MAKNYLLGNDVGVINDRTMRIHELASKIALRCGCIGGEFEIYNTKNILDLWGYEDKHPSRQTLIRAVKIANIKWFIRNKLKVDDPIWNGGFMYGLSKHGILRMHRRKFPTFHWNANPTIARIIEVCPYGGKLKSSSEHSIMNKWMEVPAFYLPNEESSLSFVGGLLSGGVPMEKDGAMYAKYSRHAVPYLQKLGIPIEYSIQNPIKKYSLISPFWPALFAFAMPKEISAMWFEIDNAFNAGLYAAILWKSYVGYDFIPNGIPYLRSRRTIYNQFEDSSLGAMKELEKVKSEKRLFTLDERFPKAVRMWQNKACNA